MIGCRESARLLSEQRDHRLPWRKRLSLRVHLMLCGLCRVYGTQVSALCGICHHVGAHSDEAPGAMPEERKQQIKAAMSKEPR